MCEQLRGRCHAIAVNNVAIDTVDSVTGQMIPALAPWADVLFASDAKWWRHVRDEGEGVCGLEDHRQQRSALAGGARLQFSPRAPFDERPTHVVMGGNSGYQAVHIAAHFGAARILLFGFDMREVNNRRHYFGNHPAPCNSKGRFHQWIRNMQQLAQRASASGASRWSIARRAVRSRGLKVSTLEREFPPLVEAQVA